MTGDSPGGRAFAPVDPLLASYPPPAAPPPAIPAVAALPPLTRAPVDPAWGAPQPVSAPSARPAAAGTEYDPFRGTWDVGRARWSRRRKATVWTVVAGATAVVVALVSLGAASLLRDTQQRSRRTEAANAAVAAALPRLEAFVAQDTGRPFTHPVAFEVLADAQFLAVLDAASGAEPITPVDDNDDLGVTYAALGLVPDPDTFWGATDSGRSNDVTGFYDDDTKKLYVRGTAWTPTVETTVLHELVHADQDQSFNLSALVTTTSTADESYNALDAVIEGEATLVEDDYAATQSASWRSQVDSELSGGPSASRAVDDLGRFPYSAGEAFVRGLRSAGGTTAVDRAFRTPPQTTRALASPRQWLDGALPPVRPPARPLSPTGSSGDVQDVGVLGVEGLWVAADSVTRSTGDPDLAPFAGWAGDSYVATENEDMDRWCFVDDLVFTDAASRERALAALRGWTSADHVDVSVQGATGVRLSGCHPVRG